MKFLRTFATREDFIRALEHGLPPTCSWQKGLVEEINSLIRQYFPRHINMNQVTRDQIYEIQEKLNNRPRKSLDYKTPNQIYAWAVSYFGRQKFASL